MLRFLQRISREDFLFALAYAVIIMIGVVGYLFISHTANDQTYALMQERARSLAAMVAPQELTGLTLTGADLQNPSYGALKGKLTRTRQANKDLRFVYLMAQRDGHVYFIADSEDPASADYSPPGQEYTEASPLLRQGWNRGVPGVLETYADRWGDWISALAPIIDAQGNTVALIGIDVSAVDHRWTLLTEAGLLFLVMVSLTALVAALHHVRYAERDVMRLKTDFLALASHELRSPLSKLRWELSLLVETPGLAGATHDRIQALYTQVIKLIRTSSSLLQTVSADHGLLRSDTHARIDLAPIVKRAVENLQESAQAKEVQIRTDDDFDAPIDVFGNEDHLLLVFENLIGNAVKYSREGGTIAIRYEVKGDEQCISITDSGMGIPEAEQNAVFEGFRRATNASHSTVLGSGFGLYIVKKIVAMHGGVVRLDSTEGAGTTITVTLPVPHSH